MKCRRCGKLLLSALMGKDVCAPCQAQAERDWQVAQAKLGDECFDDLRIFVSNGMTPKDVAQVLEAYTARGLRDTFVPRLRLYRAAADQVMSDSRVDEKESAMLAKLRGALQLGVTDTAAIDQNMHRKEALDRIVNGELPRVDQPGLPLKSGELAHFVFEPVEFHQERVVGRESVGGSRGVSVRIVRGVSYRVGASRGQTVSRTALVQLDEGRLVFAGGEKSFSIPLEKILDTTPYANGMSVTRDSTAANAKPYVFAHEDGELLNTAFSACWNAAS